MRSRRVHFRRRRGELRLKTELSPSFLIPCALLLALNPNSLFFCVPAAALIHEAGHLAAARQRRRRIEKVSLSLTGALIVTSGGRRSYRDDAAVAFWGAGANLLALTPILLLYRARPGQWLLCFFFANLLLALFNLLPAKGLDGGELLESLVCLRASPEAAGRVLEKTSKISLALLLAAGIWLFLEFRNASLMLIFVSFMFRAT